MIASNAANPNLLIFSTSGPFYKMVSTFLLATVGMGPLFEKDNALNLDASKIAMYFGRFNQRTDVDMQQVQNLAWYGGITPNDAVNSLCCMVVNAAYETVKEHNDNSPEFELFRHLRNAASHMNQFNFFDHEPKRPAAWRGFEIDHTSLGTTNSLFGIQCFGLTVGPADVLQLMSDIEKRILK